MAFHQVQADAAQNRVYLVASKPFEEISIHQTVAFQMANDGLTDPGQITMHLAQHSMHTLELSGIARVGNDFGHDRGINDSHFEAFWRNDTRVLAQGYVYFQELTRLIITGAMPKLHHGSFVHGQPMLKDHFTAEVLPVGILHPAIQNITIRECKHMLEQLQAHMQPNRQPRMIGFQCI